MSDFAANLRLLTSERRSVSQICREIGINRQQFSRYLNGTSLPSAHNLRRICAYFGLTESDLLMPQAEFRRQYRLPGGAESAPPWRSLFDAFPGDRVALRRYLGLYHTHFLTPSWPGTLLRGLVSLTEEGGLVVSRAVERSRDPHRGVDQRTRYTGLVAYRGDRLFVVERERLSGASIVETILFPAHRHQLAYLRGVTFGLSWRPRRAPYASRAIWKRLPPSTDLRAALRACGRFAFDSREVDPVVRNFLGTEIFPTRKDLDGGDFF